MTEETEKRGVFTEGQLAVIEKKIFEHLPCATNKECKQVSDMKKVIIKTDNRTWFILAAIIANILLQIAFNLNTNAG